MKAISNKQESMINTFNECSENGVDIHQNTN